MKKLLTMLLLAAFSISTFAAVLPQQDTVKHSTRKTTRTTKTTPKSKQNKTKKTWKKTKRDTMRVDTPVHTQVH
jgi:hypothetical protein